MRDLSQANQLAKGIQQLALTVSPAQQQLLLDYVALLVKWNKAYNLTAVRDPHEMVIRHLLDSLTILPYVKEGELLDVGTGAGIPGIILAICRPNQAFTLLDSNGKKTRFVRQAALELKLPNVTVVQERVEKYGKSVAQICCRAFAPLADIIKLCGGLLEPNGQILAMKAHDEPQDLPLGWQQSTIDLTVPGLDEKRRLIVLTRQGEKL